MMKIKIFHILLFLSICSSSFGQYVIDQKGLDKMFNAAEKAIYKKNTYEADSLVSLYCSICETPELQNTFEYTKLLSYTAGQAAANGNLDKAIEIGHRVVKIRNIAPNCEKQHLATSMNELAIYYSYKGNYPKAIELERDAIKIFKAAQREKDINYSVCLSNLATFLSYRGEEGDYQEAVNLGEQAIKRIKKNTYAYVNALNSLIVYYSQLGNIAKADKLSEEVMQKSKKFYGENSNDYAILLNNFGIRWANIHNFPKAIEYSNKARDIYRKSNNTNTLSYGNLLVNLASFNKQVDNYKETIQLLLEAKPLLKKIVGTGHPDYIRCISELAATYNHIGESEKAEEFNQAIKKPEKQDENSIVYGLALSKEAEINASAGKYEKAIELEKSALNIFIHRNDTLNIGQSNMHLCNYYCRKENYPEAIKCGYFAIDCFKKKENLSYMAQALNAVSIAEYYNGDYKTAKASSELAIKAYRFVNNESNSIYAKTLANLALYNFMCDSTDYAINTAEKALNIMQKTFGEDHPENASLHYNLANFYHKKKDAKRIAYHYKKALNIQSNVIRSNFSHKTAKEREAFWDSKSYIFKVSPTLAFIYNQNDRLISAAYNARLLTEGLLLNSEINFKNLLLQTKDSLLLQKYERLDMLYRNIESLYKLTAEHRGNKLKEAQVEAQQLEKDLVKGCKEYGDFMSNLAVTYHDVAQKLGEQDIAIEFLDLKVEGAGTTYIALYLRKGWDTPRLKILFNQNDLDKLKYNNLPFTEAIKQRKGINLAYSDPRLGNLVWDKILKECKDVKNIYFSPTGLLYQLGIEYLPYDKMKSISDHYNCYRLSSTKLVGEAKVDHKIKSASVFGGLNYDMNTQDLTLQSHNMAWNNFLIDDVDDERSLESNLLATDSLITRGGVGYLYGTLTEADSIGEILMQQEIPTDMFLENYGTEESFKALSGRNRSLIHIATHGFFLTQKDLSDKNVSNIFNETPSNDQSLNYSGLLLAGANNALKGEKVPEGIENGILTAREISMLDFRNLDLVVLSACKTGVGEIKEDGVFGLQRGFKKAGAKTLLMSLWNVNDAATQSMMIEFYSALMSGIPKHKAFQIAQKKMRNGKFKDPFYWASFIILDSLD